MAILFFIFISLMHFPVWVQCADKPDTIEELPFFLDVVQKIESADTKDTLMPYAITPGFITINALKHLIKKHEDNSTAFYHVAKKRCSSVFSPTSLSFMENKGEIPKNMQRVYIKFIINNKNASNDLEDDQRIEIAINELDRIERKLSSINGIRFVHRARHECDLSCKPNQKAFRDEYHFFSTTIPMLVIDIKETKNRIFKRSLSLSSRHPHDIH